MEKNTFFFAPDNVVLPRESQTVTIKKPQPVYTPVAVNTYKATFIKTNIKARKIQKFSKFYSILKIMCFSLLVTNIFLYAKLIIALFF